MLFSGTVRFNLKMGNENATDEALWQALETAQGRTLYTQTGRAGYRD